MDDGELVEAGQPLAVLDALPILEADVARLEAQLAYERAELRRSLDLNDSRIVSDAEREAAQTRVRVAQAELQRVRAELARHTVRAPFSGQVIRIHAHEGERVGEQGILELGRTDRMLAIAEVYETDIVRVRLGQRATISSPAPVGPLVDIDLVIGATIAAYSSYGRSLYVGGACGFVIIAGLAFVFPKIGAAWAIALMVLGQSAAALAIDHYGLLGVPKDPVTLARVAGLGLVALGVSLVRH